MRMNVGICEDEVVLQQENDRAKSKVLWVGVQAFSDLGYQGTSLEKAGLMRCHGNGPAAGGRDFLHRDPDEERSAFLFLAEPVLSG